jgi:hypothetical protein
MAFHSADFMAFRLFTEQSSQQFALEMKQLNHKENEIPEMINGRFKCLKIATRKDCAVCKIWNRF